MVAEHQLNRESSRSHTIFSIMLERSMGAEGDEVIVSKLNLVDLAGSERISKTKSEGMVLKEAQQINKSLSFLEQVCFGGAAFHLPGNASMLVEAQGELGCCIKICRSRPSEINHLLPRVPMHVFQSRLPVSESALLGAFPALHKAMTGVR